jgi:hypothetical protein
MTIVLFFVIFFVVASVWDVVHVNRLYDKIVNPARRTEARSESRPLAPAVVCEHDAGKQVAMPS